MRADPFRGWATKFHWGFFGLFALQLILVLSAEITDAPTFAKTGWALAVLLLLSTATTLASLTLRLPGQNVILASVLIALIGGAAHTLDGFTSIPFGPCLFTAQAGKEIFHPLPWSIPFVWIVALLNARGVGKLMLRPWRKTRTYGFWLIGVTVALVLLFDLGLEPFATARQLWLWGPTHAGVYWYGAPWINFIAWAGVTTVILAFVTPSLINKKPAKQPRDYNPLYVWLALNLVLLASALTNHQWPAVVVIGIGNTVALAFALRGALW